MPIPPGTSHWPESLFPQQAIEPSVSNATVWAPPAAMLATGFAGVPVPLGTSHWPEPFHPQQAIEPSESNATVCR